MAVNKKAKRNRAYGLGSPLIDLAPEPIVAQRAPTTSDIAQVGTTWVDQENDNCYVLSSVSANSASWQITTAEGTGGTDGQVLVGATGADPDWANITSTGGTLVITNGTNTINMEVSGATTSSFPTDSGTATPLLGATQIAGGTNLNSAGSGSTVTINLDASPSVAGSLTAGDSLTMSAGTMTITADDNTADVIYLHADGGTSETIRLHADQGTGVASIGLISDVGGITLDSGLASADAINIDASDAAGGIDIDYGTGGCAVDGANGAFTLQTGTGAISLGADAAAKTITIGNATGATAVAVNCGTGGATFGTSANAHATTIGGTNTTSTTTLQAGTGGLICTSTDEITLDAAGVLELNSSAGVIGIGNDAVAQAINIGTGAAARTVTMGNTSGASAVVLNSGTGGIALNSTLGSTTITATEDAADAIYLHANAGTSETIKIHSDQGTGADSINLLSDVGGVTVTTGLDSANTIYLHANAGTSETIKIHADQGTGAASIEVASDVGGVTVSSGLASADAINLNASDAAGGIDVDYGTGGMTVDGANGAFTLQTGTGTISLGADAAAKDVILGNSTGASDTLISAGTGGLTLSAAGLVDVVPATDSQAATTCTVNANTGVATYTGQTTASSASVTLTVTNSVCTAGSAILCSVSTLGANDAQLTINRVKPASGSFTVQCTNEGAAAVNGDIILTFWIIAA